MALIDCDGGHQQEQTRPSCTIQHMIKSYILLSIVYENTMNDAENKRIRSTKIGIFAAFLFLFAAGGFLVYALSDSAPPSTEDGTADSSNHSAPVDEKTSEQSPDGQTSGWLLIDVVAYCMIGGTVLLFGWLIWKVGPIIWQITMGGEILHLLLWC